MTFSSKTSGGLFISTPIATSDPPEFQRFRAFCGRLESELLRAHGNTAIYCAALNIDSQDSFDDPSSSALHDFEAIGECSKFVLLYPRKLASSVLIELGYALAQQKSIVIITPQLEALPYLAQGLDKALGNVSIHLLDPLSPDALSIILDYASA